MVLGFELFDPELWLAGVILNRVGSERHFRMLETAIKSYCKTPVLGWLPRSAKITIPERHLGLQTAEEGETGADLDNLVGTLLELAQKHIDLPHLLTLDFGSDLGGQAPQMHNERKYDMRIGVAHDQAFSFYYEDNLDLLRQNGAALIPFSPMHDASLWPGLNALYLGEGYSELHSAAISDNQSMDASIRKFAASGRPVYAECGGMIFLSQQLKTHDGASYGMAGVLPLEVEVTGRPVGFGYVTVELTRDCLIGPAGISIRGHSFHYSRITEQSEITTSYRVEYSLSGRVEDEGYAVGNVLASYVHLHFRAHPAIAQNFVAAALLSRDSCMVPQ